MRGGPLTPPYELPAHAELVAESPPAREAVECLYDRAEHLFSLTLAARKNADVIGVSHEAKAASFQLHSLEHKQGTGGQRNEPEVIYPCL